MQKAIIYCRVSSDRQVNEGHGLDSQERICKDFALKNNYKVVKVFKGEGESGRLFDRPSVKELITYLDKNPFEKYVVIFDDLKRFARGVETHLKFKSELLSRGVILKCPNFVFEDSPEGRLVENVSAATAQYERESNKRVVMQKMKARLEDGFWPFCPPPALNNKKNPIYGKTLYPKEPYATIFKEAIQSYNDGILNTLEGVQEFINLRYKPLGIRPISISGAKRILSNVLYAGWIEYKPWGITLQKAKHEGFITKEAYDQVQVKLSGNSRARLRKDYNSDFPLRGFILCDECKKPMTASWHKGRTKRYAHYFCKQLGCLMFSKVVQKSLLEAKFESLLAGITPNKDVLVLVKDLLNSNWKRREIIEADSKYLISKEVDKLEEKKRQFMDRISNSTSEALIRVYEKEIELILMKQQEIEVNLPQRVYTDENFGTACDLVFKYLENPVNMWRSPNNEDKKLLLEMYFNDKLTYDLKEGFGTVNLACLVNLIITKESSKNHLVEMARIELASEKTPIKLFSLE